MAYRRSNTSDIASSRWRLAHLDELAECGIPADIRNDDRRWLYVLYHGDDLESGWSASWLSEQQASKLRALLKPYEHQAQLYDLISILQKRSANI